MKVTNEVKRTLEEGIKNLFSLIGLIISFEVKEDEDGYLIKIEAGENTGLLIGKRGENINNLRTFFQLFLKQKFGEWYQVKVNVGDWLEKQEDYLSSLAEKTIKRVQETKTPQYLYNLSSGQRRTIHLIVSETPGVTSESFGEGEERCLVIKPDDEGKKSVAEEVRE